MGLDDSLEGNSTSVSSAEVISDASPIEPSGIRQVVMLALSLCILQIGFGIVTPIFPFYIDALGVGALELGVLAASFALTRIFLAGPMGGLSDKVGRKPVLLGALIGFAIANLIYASAETIFVMIGARALEGAVSAGFYPAANAYVSDLTTPENRGTAMGYLSTGNMVGFVIGPTLGGVLAQFLGIRLPFVIAAIGTFFTVIAIQILISEPPQSVKRMAAPPKSDEISVVQVFQQQPKAYFTLAVSMFANMFAFGILEVAFMLDAVQRFGIEPIEIGVFFGIIGIITIAGNIGFGKISDKVGRKWLIVAGATMGGISLFLFMIATDVVGFYIAGMILGVAISMRGPTIQALIGDLCDDRVYGSVMGAFGAVSNSAYVVGPLLGGYLFDTSGDSISALGVASMVSFFGAIAGGIGLPRDVQLEGMCETDDESGND
ncbi:MAG: MFS transporter [Candidatus Lokiarchaeota archaeon]|nr:MFS transporter [Candidatus Lokiarchaeota archaeon]